MAGRIRTLKPEILEDEAIAELSDTARWLFVGGILLADDHGNMRASARYLRGHVWCGREPQIPVEDAIRELVDGGFWLTYSVNGQSYAHINGWAKHQRIDNANEPRLPLPPGWVAEPITRQEGRRVRTRWVSRHVGCKVGPPHHEPGAAPATTGCEVGPPDHDHDHDHDPDKRVGSHSSALEHKNPTQDLPGLATTGKASNTRVSVHPRVRARASGAGCPSDGGQSQ